MEKRSPHCQLSVVRALAGGAAIGLEFEQMIGIVMALTPRDFHKSMTTHADHRIWQDVYRPVTEVGFQGAVTMQCPACGAAELVHDTRELPYTYKGETTSIPGVVGDYCPACGESVLDAVESARVSAAMLAFNRQVNATVVDPAFIASVRKKLALDQREAAAIFGGGINAFSRYENGKTRPPLALVKLLKVLDRHPELLGEVRRL